jgi:hypothetical protein
LHGEKAAIDDNCDRTLPAPHSDEHTRNKSGRSHGRDCSSGSFSFFLSADAIHFWQGWLFWLSFS